MNDVQTKILEIKIRYETAIQQLGKYRDEIDKTRQTMADLKEMHKKGSIGTEDFQQSMAACEQQIKTNQHSITALTRQIQSQMRTEKEQEGSLNQLRAQLSKATAEYDAMSRAERESAAGQELKKKINDITGELKGAEYETERFYRNVGNYKEAVEGLGKVEEKAKGLGKAFLGLVGITSIGALGKQAKEVGTAYADQMGKVRSVTDATAMEFAMMSKEAERLGSTTRYTAQEAAEALENLTRNGLDAATATGALSGTLHLAQANAIELAESADIVTGQMNAFHLTVNDVTRINDVLSYTCAHSATNITLLNEALKNTAPIAYTSGVSIEETCAALATLADNNIKGADSGTILKQTFNGLITSTAKSKAAYDALGISMDISTVKSDGLVASLQKIMEAGPSVQQLSDIFGRRAVPGVLALTNSMDLLQEKFEMITEGAAGTTDRMFKQTYSEFTQAADGMKSAWEGLLIAVWQGQNDSLRDEFLGRQAELDEQWSGTIAKSKEAIAEIENLKKTQMQLAASFAEDGNQATADQLNAINETIAEKTAALDAGTREYVEAKQALNEEFEAQMEEQANTGMAGALQGPIEELTAAIQWIRANINELGTMIMSVIAAISLKSLIAHVKTSATTMKNDLVTNAQAATQQVNNLATKERLQRRQVERLKVQYEQASGEERKLIANKLTVAKGQLAETEKQLTKAKTTEISAMEKAAAATTATGWKGAMQSASLAVKGFVTASKTALKSFALTAILSLAIELIMKLWDAFNSGEGVIGKIGGAVKGFIQNALQKLGQIIVDVINWFIEFYNDSIVVRGAIALLGGVFKAVWTILKAGIEGIGNGFKLLGGIISGVANALKGLFTLNWDLAVQGVKQLGSAVTDFYKNQVSVAKNTGQEIADGFVESFNNVNERLDKVEWKSPNNSAAPQTGGGGGAGAGGGLGGGDLDGAGGLGSGAGGKGGKGGKGDKAAETRRKQEKLEMEAIANLQNELYKIEADGAEKRRMAVEAEYNKRIEKLRTQLATEKNLTEKARQAITQLITVIEQEKQDALVKLSAEERKKVLEEEIKNNEARLNLIRKGTGAQLSEKLKGLKEQRDAEIAQAQKDITDEDARQQAIMQITSKYEQLRLNLIAGAQDTELGLRLANLDKKHEIAVQEAEDAIAVEQGKIDKLKELSQEEIDAMSDEERAAYDRQLQEATEALARKQDALNLVNEQYNRDVIAAQESADAASLEQQKKAIEDRIAVMQNDETERLLMLKNGHEMTDEEQRADQERKLEAIGGFEAQKLEMQAEAAQAEYDAILERGQLSTQTEEEYNRELEQKRAANLAAKKAIDDAYVKQEQAKYNSMKALTSSLTGLLDTLGESNKAFAVMSKVITLAQIAIDTGRAISAGIASASSMPFPSNLAAIATTVATIIANVTTAISTVKSAKFAEGGKVTGPGTGKSDSVPAMLSNGEFVMTAAATRIYEPLLMAMNNIGRGVPMQVVSSNREAMMSESLTESFSAAAQEITPVVSVVEINDMQNRVRTIETLDNF